MVMIPVFNKKPNPKRQEYLNRHIFNKNSNVQTLLQKKSDAGYGLRNEELIRRLLKSRNVPASMGYTGGEDFAISQEKTAAKYKDDYLMSFLRRELLKRTSKKLKKAQLSIRAIDPHTSEYKMTPAAAGFSMVFPLNPTTIRKDYDISYKLSETSTGFGYPSYQGRRPQVIKFTAHFADILTIYTPTIKMGGEAVDIPYCAQALAWLEYVVFEQRLTYQQNKDNYEYLKATFDKIADKKKFIEQNASDYVLSTVGKFDSVGSSVMAPPPILWFDYGSLSMNCKITGMSVNVTQMNPYTGMPSEADVDLELTQHIPIPTAKKEAM